MSEITHNEKPLSKGDFCKATLQSVKNLGGKGTEKQIFTEMVKILQLNDDEINDDTKQECRCAIKFLAEIGELFTTDGKEWRLV